MAYNVSAAFREQCYSGESLYSCRLIIGGNTIPISQIASITISSPIIDSNSETFYIGTFISQQLTIEFKNLDGIDTTSGTNVELYISQNVEGTDIEVPIGKYVIDESPENYYQSAKIVCLDYAIKFATNLDYSSAFVDNKITIDNLLQWICNHYGVTLGSYPSINGNVEIGTYDSTVSGKRWISYIAEIKGCNAKMNRLGQLTLVPIKSSPAVTIDALKSASWELGEKFEISQVTFFDAVRNYTYGNDSENTLFLRQDNPFIIDTNVVQNVYNAVKNLQIWSLKCENYGDISLDAWDIIQYTLGNETYYTYNNNTITYAMTIMSKIETKIPTKQQEVTTNVLGGDDQQQIRRLKTEVNTIENTITLQAQQIATNTTNIATNTSDIDDINEELSSPTSTKEGEYFDLQDALDEPLIDFSLYGETQQDSTPTPSSPQEIHNVSGDNTIEICGKNKYNKATSLNNTTINTSTGKIGSNSNYITSDFIRVIPNTEYYIYGLTVVGGYNKDKTFISMIRNTNSAGAFTTPENCYYIRVRNYNQLSTEALQNETSNITYLVVGNEAITYEAYTGNSQLISLGVENLLNLTDGTYTATDITGVVNNGVITLNGTASATSFLDVSLGTNLSYVNAQNYTVSLNNQSTNGSVTLRIDGSGTFDTSANNKNKTKTFTYDGTTMFTNKITIRVASGTTLTDFVIKPQMEKGSKANSYSPYGANYIELCKIGDYQDYIYKDSDKWYLHKEIGKVVLDGSENWNYYFSTAGVYVNRDITSLNSSSTINCLSNYYKATYRTRIRENLSTTNNECATYGTETLISNKDCLTVNDFKSWLSTHNTIVYSVLATPIDTEITDTTLLEQLNRLMTLPLYKNMTHITLTPNDLQPTMKIEYYRDTSLNNTFVPKTEMDKYYTKTETIAQIQIGNSSIQQNVAEIQTTLDSNGEAINTISNQVQTLQSSTSLQISAINSQLENGVEKLTNSLVKIDANGINTSKTGETFNTQITNKTFEVKDGTRELAFIGYDNDQKRTVARMDDLESKRATIGVHRAETITKSGKKRTAWFYVGGGN